MTPDNQRHLQFMSGKKEFSGGFKFQSDNNYRKMESKLSSVESSKLSSTDSNRF